jgi:phenylpropionate dioxygenase-like ring-hydroxylating dioxygenase large terminal subunit
MIGNKLHPEDVLSRPLSQASTLPAIAYTDSEFHAFDMQHIFANTWQAVARADQLRETGDHVVAEVAGRPIIVVRGNDGKLRGFFNVCRHRAGPLALTDGNARQLQCKYHGWTYTLEGQLRAAHEMQDAQGFDISCIHLDPVQVEEWEGMVFVAVKKPAMSLAQLLHGISDRIRPIELPRMRFHSRVNYDVACNWKAYVDNYLEGYHLPHVHPGLNRLLDYRSYTTSLSTWYSYQHSPLDGTRGPYQAGEAHYYFIYPNLMLNILPDRLQTNLVLPLSSRHCRVVFDYYYVDTESDTACKMIAEDLRFSDEVQQEDIGICERVQIGLASDSYHAGRLSPKREAGVHHFQELVRQAYRDANS